MLSQLVSLARPTTPLHRDPSSLLIVLTGPSGCGKSTLVNRLLKPAHRLFDGSVARESHREIRCCGSDVVILDEPDHFDEPAIARHRAITWAREHRKAVVVEQSTEDFWDQLSQPHVLLRLPLPSFAMRQDTEFEWHFGPRLALEAVLNAPRLS
jgi:hypothetical protein